MQHVEQQMVLMVPAILHQNVLLREAQHLDLVLHHLGSAVSSQYPVVVPAVLITPMQSYHPTQLAQMLIHAPIHSVKLIQMFVN